MLVGEAPGAEEDRVGKPFVGKAGQLLDRMLASIGLDRSKVYVANMVPWRPPGNREPSPQEILSCQPFLFRQIELVAPRILLTVGGVSTKALFDTNQGILRLRGQWRELSINGHSMQAMPILHPAYLLRQPSAKQQAWRDMLSLKQMIEREK
jgi:DNA polymerase